MVSRSVPRRSVAPVFPFPAPSPPYPHPTNTRRLEITETLGIGRIEQGRIKRAARNGSNRAQAGFGAYFSSIGVRKFHVTFRGSPLRIPSNFHFSSPPTSPRRARKYQISRNRRNSAYLSVERRKGDREDRKVAATKKWIWRRNPHHMAAPSGPVGFRGFPLCLSSHFHPAPHRSREFGYPVGRINCRIGNLGSPRARLPKRPQGDYRDIHCSSAYGPSRIYLHVQFLENPIKPPVAPSGIFVTTRRYLPRKTAARRDLRTIANEEICQISTSFAINKAQF